MFGARGTLGPENGENNNIVIHQQNESLFLGGDRATTAVLIKTTLHLRAPFQLSPTAVPNYNDSAFSENQKSKPTVLTMTGTEEWLRQVSTWV